MSESYLGEQEKNWLLEYWIQSSNQQMNAKSLVLVPISLNFVFIVLNLESCTFLFFSLKKIIISLCTFFRIHSDNIWLENEKGAFNDMWCLEPRCHCVGERGWSASYLPVKITFSNKLENNFSPPWVDLSSFSHLSLRNLSYRNDYLSFTPTQSTFIFYDNTFSNSICQGQILCYY